MIHFPIKVKRGKFIYNLIKIYNNFGLYENSKTNIKECFTLYQLGMQEEIIKPEKQANKGGASKI